VKIAEETSANEQLEERAASPPIIIETVTSAKASSPAPLPALLELDCK
jgi:hypothetical protein